VSAEASELVSIPRAELDALKAELKRLRREVGRGVAMARIQADFGRAMTRPLLLARISLRHGEYVSDRLVRFPGSSWQEIEAAGALTLVRFSRLGMTWTNGAWREVRLQVKRVEPTPAGGPGGGRRR
jgi:hypothetical protein